MTNSPMIENDTNSTYCEACGCRITIGRCQHGVMPPQKKQLTWSDLFHGLTHYGALRDIRRVSVQVLGGGMAELHKWYAGCGFSPIVETHASLELAKSAGEQWIGGAQ